ncbi:MAG: hypothetical protein ACR2FN_09470 [Chitinophagaceae bacterium]
MAPNKWFSFLAKLTFISNVLFIFCFAFRYVSIVLPEFLISFMIVIGWAPFSPILNFITGFILLILLIKGIRRPAPLWIITFNLFWMFFQTVYFLF